MARRTTLLPVSASLRQLRVSVSLLVPTPSFMAMAPRGMQASSSSARSMRSLAAHRRS